MQPTARCIGGFTLIELVVVLLIMTTVMAVSAPRLTGRGEVAQLNAAAADVQALGTAARSRSILRNQSIALLYNQSTGGLQLALADDSSEEVAGVASLSPSRQLAEGLTITIESAPPERIVFLPNGSAGAGAVTIANNNGQSLRLVVSVPLGRFVLSDVQ